jgi:hypothetical protein
MAAQRTRGVRQAEEPPVCSSFVRGLVAAPCGNCSRSVPVPLKGAAFGVETSVKRRAPDDGPSASKTCLPRRWPAIGGQCRVRKDSGESGPSANFSQRQRTAGGKAARIGGRRSVTFLSPSANHRQMTVYRRDRLLQRSSGRSPTIRLSISIIRFKDHGGEAIRAPVQRASANYGTAAATG